MSSDTMAGCLAVTVVGGPTVVVELGGLRFLTDPTFDPAGSSYSTGPVTLRKLTDPALTPEEIGHVDAVLLSHDQHPDNLDGAGRSFLAKAPLVLTTGQAAKRIGATALIPWSKTTLERPGGGRVVVSAVPARHGPVGTEQALGEVTGFLLGGTDLPTVYISGDNVALEPVQALAERTGAVDLAILHLGAAKLGPFGPTPLSMNADEAVEAAKLLGARKVLAVHHEGWDHFTQGWDAITAAFAAADSVGQLLGQAPGIRVDVC
jgi:L-ascorbate metabolism protein UlaG (beta-lactamase superfamily)